MRVLIIVFVVFVLIPDSLSMMECRYNGGLPASKVCNIGCPYDGWLYGGVIVSALLLIVLMSCCAIYVYRRPNAAYIVIARQDCFTETPADVPVPEHRRYGQSSRPPPYTENK